MDLGVRQHPAIGERERGRHCPGGLPSGRGRVIPKGGKPWFRYRMALLRLAVSERDTELIDELRDELRAEFAHDAEVIAAIERALSGANG